LDSSSLSVGSGIKGAIEQRRSDRSWVSAWRNVNENGIGPVVVLLRHSEKCQAEAVKRSLIGIATVASRRVAVSGEDSHTA